MSFAHLHLHTEYSLLDGASPIDKLAIQAQHQGLAAMAITDHGNLHGARRFYDTCIKHEIKPLLGCELYVAPGNRRERRPGRLAENAHHLILLARDIEGWRNLMALSTLGYKEGFYYRPRVDKELLKRYSAGLTCLSACLQGEIPQLILEDRMEEAKAAAKWYRDTYGPDDYYFEIQDHGIPDQKKVKNAMLEMGRDLGIPVIATNDAHYLDQASSRAHDVLLCIGTGSNVDETDRFKFEGDQFYVKDEDEMRRRFSDCPQAVDNTLRVVDRCNLELPSPRLKMPGFKCPANVDRRPGQSEEDAYLQRLCEEGLARRWPQGVPEAAIDRMGHELGVLQKAGFSGYFLVVQDFVNWAKSRDIPVGPGRGSAAGSLAAYCLGITDLDPLKYGLLFERFLNPERLSPPDIDIDFADHRRDEVINYVREKYGRDKVAQVITFGTLGAKAVIRDVGRALNYTYGEVDTLARMIPFELNITLDGALEESAELREKAREPRVARLLDIARRLEGIARHASTHAAGLVVSPDPIVHDAPMCLAKGSKNEDEADPEMMTQWDMGSLEKAGLVKIDFLGLRTLTVIDDCLKSIKANGNVDVNWDQIPTDDPASYQMLALGDSHGIFQLESPGMRDLIRRFKPVGEQDLTALIALYRPGPMHMIDDFIKRRVGEARVEYPLARLESILKETYGAIIYQEQVMKIAQDVGGFSLGQADILRRAMSKKNTDLLEEQRGRFLAGAKERKVSEADADNLFNLLARFAEYGFNKSHAAAYALLAFRTAWLKTHYPAEFMAALMESESGSADRMALGVAECRRMKLVVEGPDINRSEAGFTCESGRLRFGLSAVKHVGFAAAEAIATARKEKSFVSLDDFLARVDPRQLHARAIESLIKAGALDSLGSHPHRAQLLSELPLAQEAAHQAQSDKESGQESLFAEMTADSGGRVPRAQAPSWSEGQRLAFEKEALGFYISGHPLARWETLLKALRVNPCWSIADAPDRMPCHVAGMVSRVKALMTRRSEPMYKIELEDLEGRAEVMIWPKVAGMLNRPPGLETMLLIRGRVDRGDNIQISSEACVSLESAWQWVKGLHLRSGSEDTNLVTKVKRVVESRPGNLPVYVHSFRHNKWIVQRLGKKYGFSTSEDLLDSVRGAWGEDFWFEL